MREMTKRVSEHRPSLLSRSSTVQNGRDDKTMVSEWLEIKNLKKKTGQCQNAWNLKKKIWIL